MQEYHHGDLVSMGSEHVDSRSSLEPDGGRIDVKKLVNYTEMVIASKLRQAELHRALSDEKRNEAEALKWIQIYWLKRRVENLDESGVGVSVENIILNESEVSDDQEPL